MEESENLKILHASKKRCAEEMKEVITLIGPWSINKASLAKKHNLNWRTVDRLFSSIVQAIPKEAIDNIKIMGEASIKKSMAICERILADPNSKTRDRLDAIQKINETLKHYTEFLEQYNMKPKVAEELNIGVAGSLDMNKLLEIAQEKKETPGTG